MLTNLRPLSAHVLRYVAILHLLTAMLQGAAPTGWFIAGNKPAAYDSGIDVAASYSCRPSAYLKSNQAPVHGFGTLMQSFRADHYFGKRVRFSAFVKTEGAKEWAGLWMRIDKAKETAAFDNMHNRPITGSTNWQKYEVVLDVPQDASSISFGVLLIESGEVWLNNAKFEAVEPTVLPTDGDVVLKPAEPINLDFEK